MQTHNRTTCVVQHAAVQMSGPHFTCGSGWPSTSLLSLHLLPSICPIPCFSPLCQDFSSVSRHGVRVLHESAFSSFPFSPSLKHLPPSLSDNDDLWLVASGHLSNGKPEYPLSENRATQETVKSKLKLLHFNVRSRWQCTSAYKRDLFQRMEAFSFWYNVCPTAEIKCFPSCYEMLLACVTFICHVSEALRVAWAVHADTWTAFLFILFGSDH